MRKYLATLHQRSHEHKKRFALLASGGFTLLIFSFWSVATFGTGGTLAQNNIEVQRAHEEVGPLESIGSTMSASVGAILENFGLLKSEVNKVNLESDYTEMRNNVLEVYGQ